MMDKLTDFELNKAIAEALGFKFIEPFTGGYEGAITVKVPHTHVERYLDYCNSWNDLMPLVVEYLPMLGVGRKEFIDLLQSENPQRGLAECLLFALQEKQGDE